MLLLVTPIIPPAGPPPGVAAPAGVAEPAGPRPVGCAASSCRGRCLTAATLQAPPGWSPPCWDACVNGDEILAGDWILVLLPQELLFDKQVDVRRKRVGILALKQADRVHVLFAAEHELFFFLPLSCVLPDRHGRRHDNGHHGDADNDSSHRVPVVATVWNDFALTR